MKTLVLGDNIAYQPVISYLEKKGHSVDLIRGNCFIDSSLYDCIFFPIEGIRKNFLAGDTVLSPDFLKNSKENVLLFAGKGTPCLREILKRGNKKCTYLLEDPVIKRKQDFLFAENILGTLLLKAPLPICEAEILLVGEDSTLPYLSFLLQNMGAHVYTLCKDMYELSLMLEENDFSKIDIIVDTSHSLGEKVSLQEKDPSIFKFSREEDTVLGKEGNSLFSQNTSKILALGKSFVSKIQVELSE